MSDQLHVLQALIQAIEAYKSDLLDIPLGDELSTIRLEGKIEGIDEALLLIRRYEPIIDKMVNAWQAAPPIGKYKPPPPRRRR